MKKSHYLMCLIIALPLLLLNCTDKKEDLSVESPNKILKLKFEIIEGKAYYAVLKNEKNVITNSKLGFKLKELPPLNGNFKVINYKNSSYNETWEQPWGEQRVIRNNYNELKVELQQKDSLNRKLNVVFRVFDDGVGFRYEFPEQEKLKEFTIMDEETEFALTDIHDAWWIPAYSNMRYESLYRNTPINKMDTVHTPVTMKTKEGLYLSFHEATLTDFSSMTLFCTDDKKLNCDLVPWANGDKVYVKAPFKTPWRTIQVSEDAGGLITSNLILNLNEPNRLGDVSYVKPGKYLGIWWGMHINTMTWSQGEKHGASNKNVKEYIDFAAQNGFSGVLVEGWNVGWDAGTAMDYTKPYPDFDTKMLSEYGTSKGVKIIGHHETWGGVEYYKKQIDTAYQYYVNNGIDIIKTGFVGDKMNYKEWHHGQYGVNFYHEALLKAAEHKIALVVHEPIKATGKRRTYPNMASREGARGQEFNAWSSDGGNPPSHTVILPFTRLLGGPMDFTPGVFDILIPNKPNNRVNTTLAKQLALYVTIYAPYQMACDLPSNYEKNLLAFQFIKDVVTDWDTTLVLNAEIGEYLTMVRKDRNSEQWFLGSITNEKERDFEVSLDFLDVGKKYKAQVYADSTDADWETNPTAIYISEIEVDKSSKLKIKLAKGGGQAVRFIPVD